MMRFLMRIKIYVILSERSESKDLSANGINRIYRILRCFATFAVLWRNYAYGSAQDDIYLEHESVIVVAFNSGLLR